MKLITLNAWCGIKIEPLKKFIERQSKDTDIFCFQEIRNGKCLSNYEGEVEQLFNLIENILVNFKGYYTEMSPGIGIATFVKNTFEVESFNSSTILFSEDVKNISISNGLIPYPRVMQVITLKNKMSVLNFHGVPGDLKKDTKERELQTKRLIEILDDLDGSKILVGDFNLNPDTKAISELEEKMRNLIKESNYKTTRSNFYEKIGIMPFADYVFVSEDLKVKDFKVLPDEVSDHLPLFLEFN
jgi:endonuclease/exonuclease/phosphatase family metal-dependent hydrolase